MQKAPALTKQTRFAWSLTPWLCLALISTLLAAVFFYSQWQSSQRQQQLLTSQLAQQKRIQQRELTRIGQRLGQLQAQVSQVSQMSHRLVSDYDLMDELPVARLDTNLLQRPFNGFADLNQTLSQVMAHTQEYGITLVALESMLLNLHINEITQVQGHPVPGTSELSSGFGKRSDPFSGRARWHRGLDFRGKIGEPIAATAAGVVSVSEHHKDFGNMVEINHGQGWITRYAHLDSQLVEVGEYVEQGQLIARMGRSGRATGVHLHYEVLKGNKQLNPARFILN
ncbi:M23 family metallopeptidase [Oceanisphaera avium]|uniref:M23ase beta-sheet core domain-containing protein n=1 Tax=Oceanisphaera avium TaxID=1903694 RepID=A0A1Y0CZT9_9GAMM|nr:M23 family metallopeptidase [Oceanisphaera avium]ART80850.1 hypothetical protein CBP12_12355 [Oceanisphaera avium]